jgi:hypothetical protein
MDWPGSGELRAGTASKKQQHKYTYLATYGLFVSFFRKRIAVTDLQPEDAKSAVVLIYTWMQPATLDPACWKHFARAKRALLKDSEARLSAEQIDEVKSFVGRSLIATSKFLHFFNPTRYAIWDRNVAWAAYRKTRYWFNRTERYVDCLDDLKALKLESAVREPVRTFIPAAGILRTNEFALFHLGIFDPKPPSAKKQRLIVGNTPHGGR